MSYYILVPSGKENSEMQAAPIIFAILGRSSEENLSVFMRWFININIHFCIEDVNKNLEDEKGKT
ncbi:MAG: hypothetical protein LUE16_06975 [Lachnospiraceae bacterium]|nr:hypothetical protein [Lachnospiraceae bacterium]